MYDPTFQHHKVTLLLYYVNVIENSPYVIMTLSVQCKSAKINKKIVEHIVVVVRVDRSVIRRSGKGIS